MKRELTDDDLESVSAGTVHLALNLGFAKFDLAINQYGACFNYGVGFHAGYDGAVCTGK